MQLSKLPFQSQFFVIQSFIFYFSNMYSSDRDCQYNQQTFIYIKTRLRKNKKIENRIHQEMFLYNIYLQSYRQQMLSFRLFARFCQMKYYKEIASFLKIKVPVLNEEIKISQHINCVVHGIKQIQPDTPVPPSAQESVVPQSPIDKQLSSHLVPQPLYIYQQHSQEIVPFQKALSISKTLQMDLNLMRQGNENIYPILTISSFRKHVYSEYFINYIKRRGKEGFKGIRLGQKIEDNDLRNKIDNIKRMIKNGERRFKLMATNDSDRSEKVLIQFAKLFGQEVQPYLQTVRQGIRKRQEERWAANLVFEDEVPVDIDQVNKKWRRRQYENQYEKRDRSAEQLQALFQDKDVRMEKQIYNAFKELNLKMPPKFQKMANDQRQLEVDKLAFYRSVESDADPQEEWDDQQQQKFKQKTQRYNKQFFNERTATQIIEQMENLKRNGYEGEAQKVARFKQLKQQLQNILKKNREQDI